MIKFVLFILIFSFLFISLTNFYLYKSGIDVATEMRNKAKNLEKSDYFVNKYITLKKRGANYYILNGDKVSLGHKELMNLDFTLGKWYAIKLIASAMCSLIGYIVVKVLSIPREYGFHINPDSVMFVVPIAFIVGWFILDAFLYFRNKSSNDEMLPDIMEMSRSVLYGKRGGQYISDAVKDSLYVVENKRLKTALISLKINLDLKRPLDECFEDFEGRFDNAEISSFCAIIKSLQATGQIDEALQTLEKNIEREEASVSRRRSQALERKTVANILFVSIDMLAIILYIIIISLIQMQMQF